MGQRKRATLSTIADRVGVSVTTISRVLSGQASKYRISKETEEKICRAAKELNYSPNQLARALRLKRTYTIGLIIPDISNPFFSSIAKSIEIQARKLGYSIILCDSLENTELEIESIKLLRDRKVDGMIICPVGLDIEHLNQLHKEGMIMVTVDRYFSQLKCPYVVSDNFRGAMEAVCYFIDNGHRNIGCIQGIVQSSVNNDRVRGYREALKMHDIPVDESLIVGDSFGERNGYIGAKILINRPKRPTAIFATSNLISLGVLRAISEETLKIPDDISIISFDEQPYSDFLSTPMTTVAQQSAEIGYLSIKLLIDQIEVHTAPRNNCMILPTKLIKRQSVKNLFQATYNQNNTNISSNTHLNA